ncbi:hypothetical protein [Streptomyces chiangmaiensis]|uniref:Uncharacterized protein n=1 Tax=Streptomyces chiangmaiensis TaxID=766497 RepID=A0ABU7FXI8_9ACTN|nr:hypothetical protein [Streptomyces chiangmaiensis]MED7827784.1 hypothetical protein [Streptomyces chiangmaiensis]
MSTPTRCVYEFAEGSREMVDLLSGKGAGLAGMTPLGLPLSAGCHRGLE